MFYWKIKNPFLVIVLVLMAFVADAQNTTFSPYSRYGLGKPFETSSNAGRAFGGGIGLPGNQFYLFNNTAAVGKGDVPSFDWGFNFAKNTFQSERGEATFNNGSVHHFSFGMPLKRGWGMQFGIAPYTQVGYSITDDLKTDVSGRDTAQYQSKYLGQGGVNRASIGFGKEIFNKNDSLSISIGADFGYFFGNRDLTRYVEWVNGSNFFNTKARTESLIYGVGTRFSTSAYTITDKGTFGLGVTFDPGFGLNLETDESYVNFKNSAFGTEQIRDTAYSVEGKEETYKEPSQLKVGVSYAPNEHWMFTADFQNRGSNGTENWSSANRKSFSASYQAVARFNTFTSFFKSIRYTFNMYSGNSGLILNGEELTEFGTGFAMLIPLKKSNSTSMFVIGVNYREFGTTNNQLLKETSVQGFIGLTLRPTRLDRWFVKRKYN